MTASLIITTGYPLVTRTAFSHDEITTFSKVSARRVVALVVGQNVLLWTRRLHGRSVMLVVSARWQCEPTAANLYIGKCSDLWVADGSDFFPLKLQGCTF